MKHLAKLALAAALVCAAACGQAPAQTEPSALDVIMSRKSVRSYTAEPVSDAQVETLLRAAMAAPTGMNQQPWRFVVVRDQDVKDKLAGPRGGVLKDAPVVIVVCGETTFTRTTPDGETRTMENGNWTADCAAATENLLLAAEAIGLGAVWTAGYPYEDRMGPAREALELPDNVSSYCLVAVGHPAGDDKPKDKWKPENIHYDKW
mgnify:CR=1 FL=1